MVHNSIFSMLHLEGMIYLYNQTYSNDKRNV